MMSNFYINITFEKDANSKRSPMSCTYIIYTHCALRVTQHQRDVEFRSQHLPIYISAMFYNNFININFYANKYIIDRC